MRRRRVPQAIERIGFRTIIHCDDVFPPVCGDSEQHHIIFNYYYLNRTIIAMLRPPRFTPPSRHSTGLFIRTDKTLRRTALYEHFFYYYHKARHLMTGTIRRQLLRYIRARTHTHIQIHHVHVQTNFFLLAQSHQDTLTATGKNKKPITTRARAPSLARFMCMYARINYG